MPKTSTSGNPNLSYMTTVVKNSKSWWKSKTLWFNLIVLLMGSVQLYADTYPVPPEVLGLILGIGNLLLRFVTNTKLSK